MLKLSQHKIIKITYIEIGSAMGASTAHKMGAGQSNHSYVAIMKKKLYI
jgi:hypothetical protein